MARRRWKTLYGLSCGLGAKEKDEKRRGARVQKVTRVDVGLAMRVHVYSATMYQGKKKEREEREREREREKKEVRAQGVKVKVIYCVHE